MPHLRLPVGFLFALGAFFLILGSSRIAAQPPVPANCSDGEQSSGAIYRICLPAEWNGQLVVYAHGYVAPTEPIGIPETQMVLPGTTTRLETVVTGQGFAFATSSFSRNGLAILEGVADLTDVVSLFASQQSTPTHVLLVGVSEGALITTLAVEQYPEIFAGGLALCGPIGGFRGQINHFGNFRTLFDYFLPGILPESPIEVPVTLLSEWESGFYTDTVQPALLDPANGAQIDQLLAVAGAAFDETIAESKVATIRDILWYNVFATNDATEQLGGQPFGNADWRYSGSLDDNALNAAVARFGADSAALATMAADYEPSGRLQVPLITLHTTGDPVVPYWQAARYWGKTLAADNLALHEHRRVEAYGHCQFSAFDVLGAFNRLVTLVANPPEYQPVYRLYLPVIAD